MRMFTSSLLSPASIPAYLRDPSCLSDTLRASDALRCALAPYSWYSLRWMNPRKLIPNLEQAVPIGLEAESEFVHHRRILEFSSFLWGTSKVGVYSGLVPGRHELVELFIKHA